MTVCIYAREWPNPGGVKGVFLGDWKKKRENIFPVCRKWISFLSSEGKLRALGWALTGARLGVQGKEEAKDRTAVFAAADGETAAVAVDDVFGDPEAEAGTG